MEQSCKYHPLETSTYFCVACESSFCDQCIDDSRLNSVPRCFHCNHELESSGPGNIEPFWRRLQQSFWYPLSAQSMFFILFISLLCSVALYLPFALLIYLLLFGTVFKYCLSCLSHTTDGYMKPPDITEAFVGGFKKMLALIVMVFLAGLLIGLANKYLGPAIGGIMALAVTLSFPAIIINYAITDSMVESLNPANIINLVNSIGLPFGLILGFILIMSGSIAVMYQLVLWIPSSIDSILLYAVTFYYLIVLHHLMGYMVFQYQGALGFSARLQDGSNKRRGNQAIAMAKISALVKEAEFTDATQLFQEQLQINLDNLLLNNQFFEFLLSTKNQLVLTDFLPKYFDLLAKQGRNDLISRNHKRLVTRIADFELSDPALKLQIAQASFAQNDPQTVIKLLHGIHKKHPDFKDLLPALTLLADALDEYPKYKNHADACRKMILRLSNDSTEVTKF
jgi:tetratricopeptide (TPR) repeat protein